MDLARYAQCITLHLILYADLVVKDVFSASLYMHSCTLPIWARRNMMTLLLSLPHTMTCSPAFLEARKRRWPPLLTATNMASQALQQC
jgi:hypothetical protein